MLAALFKDNGPLVKVFGSSNMIDRVLAALFVLFWLCLSGYGVFLLFYTPRVYG